VWRAFEILYVAADQGVTCGLTRNVLLALSRSETVERKWQGEGPYCAKRQRELHPSSTDNEGHRLAFVINHGRR
jgi:hypothetical protein